MGISWKPKFKEMILFEFTDMKAVFGAIK